MSESNQKTKQYIPDESRFEASKMVLAVDRFMNYFIKIGGLSIVTLVLGIFVFILWQILPLFQGAKVEESFSMQLPQDEYVFVGTDEYLTFYYTMSRQGTLGVHLRDESGKVVSRFEPIVIPSLQAASTEGAVEETSLSEEQTAANPLSEWVTVISKTSDPTVFVVGTSQGRVGTVKVNIVTEYSDGQRRLSANLEVRDFYQVGEPGLPVKLAAFGDGKENKLLTSVQELPDGGNDVRVGILTQQVSLFGAGDLMFDKVVPITELVGDTKIDKLLSNKIGDSIIFAMESGEIRYIFQNVDEFYLRQQFKPFGDEKISKIDFLFGDVSLVIASESGANGVFSLFVPEGGNKRVFGQTKHFDNLPSSADFYSGSLRNKSFVIGSGDFASFRYTTTERILWEGNLKDKIKLAFIAPKYDAILFLDTNNVLHVMALDDPHPDGGWKALFGKVWYEGSNKPDYSWQSTGGSDDFEPKLSLIPLIVGTLKGTLYAMIFAVPIALMAAIYVSQFTARAVKQVVKPTMEIMASLPSVVLGFLAALWLAPLIEDKVPSVILIFTVVPVAAFMAGMAWMGTPTSWRNWMGRGNEWWVFLPVLAVLTWVCWNLGPSFERLVFSFTDPATGETISSFKAWWPHATGADYQQRNSLVVGFVMGFAVIPIIFTISEDALSNVPATMTAGSLALGASRWQTAMRIVLPTASAGIFSALMIGLGRAVGETMIVVMATGNTPIMDLNIFSGMRTLSANIAVELPEAPHHGTLYRALFLGAMVLFLMTFIVNTGAEILRQHPREKYKTV